MKTNYENETLKNNIFYKAYKEGIGSSISKMLSSKKLTKFPNNNETSTPSAKQKIEMMKLHNLMNIDQSKTKTILLENDPDSKRLIAFLKAEIDNIHKINKNLCSDIDQKEKIIESLTKNNESRDSSNLSRFHDESSYFNKGLTSHTQKKAPHLGDEEISEIESNNDIYKRVKAISELKTITWESQKYKYLLCDDEDYEISLQKDFSKFSQFFYVTLFFKNKKNSFVSNLNISAISSEG